MSDQVFPLSLPGCDIAVSREPYTSVNIVEAVSGKEYRASWWSASRYRYRVKFNLLRSGTELEFQELFSFFMRHFGQLDSFLFLDPEDSSVVDHGFGAGNGSTTMFQLQRSLLGDVYDVLGGPWAVSSKPRTNLCLRSQEMDSGSWSKSFGVIAGTDAGVAPDGTVTADLFVEDTSTNLHRLIQTRNVGVAGTVYTLSVFVKPAGRSRFLLGLFDTTFGSGRYATIDTTTLSVSGLSSNTTGTVTPIAGGWFRLTVTGTSEAGGNISVNLRLVNDAGQQTYAGDGVSGAYVWGWQLEIGSTPTKYIPTVAAAVTVTPSYWPAFVDGFEPVHEPIWSTVQLTQDGDWQGKRTLYPWARTNHYTYSEQLDQWTKTAATVTPNATTAPDGTATADLVIPTATTAYHSVARGGIPDVTAGLDYTFSVYAKAGGYTTMTLLCRTPDGQWRSVQFNLSDGTLVSATNATGVMVAAPSGFYRCSMTLPAGTVSGALMNTLACYPVSSGSYLGDGTSGVYFWGAQWEQGSAATPYIPTPSSTAVTRTDYSMGTNGQVTLVVAPPSGACLAWTGSYYRRVRFAKQGLVATRMFDKIWESDTVDLVSVR